MVYGKNWYCLHRMVHVRGTVPVGESMKLGYQISCGIWEGFNRQTWGWQSRSKNLGTDPINNGAFTYKHEGFHQPAGGLTRQDLGHKGYRVIVNMGAMGVENIGALLQRIYKKNLSHTKFLPDFWDVHRPGRHELSSYPGPGWWDMMGQLTPARLPDGDPASLRCSKNCEVASRRLSQSSHVKPHRPTTVRAGPVILSDARAATARTSQVRKVGWEWPLHGATLDVSAGAGFLPSTEYNHQRDWAIHPESSDSLALASYLHFGGQARVRNLVRWQLSRERTRRHRTWSWVASKCLNH